MVERTYQADESVFLECKDKNCDEWFLTQQALAAHMVEHDAGYRRADILHQFYWGEGRSLAEVASILDCSVHTVRGWMKEHGIPRRSKSQASKLSDRATSD